MRIAHLITRMIVGGAQENTLLCCRDLIRIHGEDILLVTGPALGPEGDLLARGDAADLPVHLIPTLRRAIHPTRDWRSYRALRQVLREFQPDVVHTHSAKAGLLGRLAAASLRVPVIVHTVHGAPFHAYQPAIAREFFRQCEKYGARRCHQLVSVADAMSDQLVAAGVAPREKFLTIYSGMEVEPLLAADRHRAEMRQTLGLQETDVLVGKIARLFHLKGHTDVIRAAQTVVARHPQTHFLLVGDGILRDPLARQIEAAGLTGHFHFTGLVDPAEIPRWIGAMDILVHASLREGLARALPQALIAGKPVVSYDVDGAREVVLPGLTGFLVVPRDVAALADALSQLVADAPLRHQYGTTGQRRFTAQFRHEEMTRQLHALYTRLLAGAGQGGRDLP